MHEQMRTLLLALGLGGGVLALTAIARRLPIPSPILQVLAGLLIGLLPGVHIPALDPDIVFLVFLPPVLWAAAYFTSLRDLQANARPIGLLAIGLVLATTAVVAVAARALLPGMPWAVAVALGAIVSPPDAVAAEAVIKRLPVPHRIVSVLEGESLVNDASALVLYRTAIVAAVTGHFSWGESVVRFFVDAGVGILVGLVVGWLVVWVSERTEDSLAEILLTLLAPYVAWAAAELLHASAVLAVVTGGLYVRRHFSSVVTPSARLQARAVWQLLVFVVNALIFLLLGLQMAALVDAVPAAQLGGVLRAGAAIALVTIVVRLLWVPLGTAIPRWLSPALARRDPMPPWRNWFLISWAGMRGIVSLASALAIPLLVADGTPFPFRNEVIVITLCVILVTLVVQGLTLAPMIRAFDYPPETRHHAELGHARREASRMALDRLADLRHEPWAPRALVLELEEEYRRRPALQFSRDDENEGDIAARRRLQLETLRAERRALIRLRNEHAISDEVLAELETELDVEATRLGMGDVR